MKILWLTNLRLPVVDDILGEKAGYFGGGWLSGLLGQVLRTESNEVVLCYPEFAGKTLQTGRRGAVAFYGFPINARKNRLGTCDVRPLAMQFQRLIEKEGPDVIHIHGTEFQFSYAMAQAAAWTGNLGRTVVSIQGMTSVYARHFYGNLPRDVRLRRTVKEWLIADGPGDRYRSFLRRGEYEIRTLKLVEHVAGRTGWDYINCRIINPALHYHQANEILREVFYTGCWDPERCEKHTVFVSQAGTMLKGFHIVLEAAVLVSRFYPDLRVKVAGPKITEGSFVTGSSYGLYIRKMIRENGLSGKVEFTGPQNEKQMKAQMLAANVFVSASSIENSPNSLGEAMLLGMPCIASDVGGVADLMTHLQEGYLYPADAPDMLAHYMIRVFSEGAQAAAMGRRARARALQTHDAQINRESMEKLYRRLADSEKQGG